MFQKGDKVRCISEKSNCKIGFVLKVSEVNQNFFKAEGSEGIFDNDDFELIEPEEPEIVCPIRPGMAVRIKPGSAEKFKDVLVDCDGDRIFVVKAVEGAWLALFSRYYENRLDDPKAAVQLIHVNDIEPVMHFYSFRTMGSENLTTVLNYELSYDVFAPGRQIISLDGTVINPNAFAYIQKHTKQEWMELCDEMKSRKEEEVKKE